MNEINPESAEGRGFLIEWNGTYYDALAVIKRNKVYFRTGDGRTLGRANVIGRLIRPGEQPGVEPAATPATPVVESDPLAEDQPATDGGHWAAAAPSVLDAPATPPALEIPPSSVTVTLPVPAPAATPPTPAVAPAALAFDVAHTAVRLEDATWVATNPDGSVDAVWAGAVRVGVVDKEIAGTELRLARLRSLRAAVNTDRELAIAETISRLAAADGVADPSTAPAEQQGTWRRYAEGLIGE